MNYPKIKLGELCEFRYGESLPEAKRANGSFPVYGSNGIVGWHDSSLTSGETIIVGRKGSAGEVNYSPKPCWPIDTTYYIEKTNMPCDFTWLYYTLTSANLSELEKSAAVPGLNRNDAYEVQIVYPPISEQKQIAATLQKVDRIRRLRRYVRRLSESYLQSVFLEMFGDPMTNPKKWDIINVEDICELVRGSSPRPQGDKRFFGGPIPRLMIADITRDGIFVTPKIDTLTELGAKQSRPMKAGEVVMAVSGVVGLPAILEVDACIHDGFVGFRDLNKKFAPIFFLTLLQLIQEQSKSQASGAIWQNLTTAQVKEWKLICPPYNLQSSFNQIVKKYFIHTKRIVEAERQTEHLFQSLINKIYS